MKSLISEDGHDSRNDLTCDSSLFAVFDPFEEDLIVIEQLSYDEVSPCINLLFKESDIVFTAESLQMYFRVTCHTDAKVVAIFFTNELN